MVNVAMECVVIDNNFLGKLATEGCAIAAPCRTKVAEKVLEVGVKAGITGIMAKEIADKISSEDLDHLIMLQMMGNDAITESYLNTLQDKYTQVANPTDLPTHTGGDQSGDIRKYPNHTGGNQQLEPGSIPNHTGNEENRSGVAPNHTGNTEDKLDVGGNTTVTPIPDGPKKDDFIYQAKGEKPENYSPVGAGRSGAFNEAKRRSGIPVGKHPDRVLPNVDKRGRLQPGKIYEFDVPKAGGGTQTIQIRDDAKGHDFGINDPQNREPHFNDEKGNHYDY
ncbi:HNH/endonuclease VII fold putative polymorphic toxin [Photorhabdus heterorhabditis]|uniref:HNH/endonuclease VII fold putative polymorphic toxin n=1 Tax=Photorhabdus heterorhabditis TaxID=880156 RepID=UPI0030D993A2